MSFNKKLEKSTGVSGGSRISWPGGHTKFQSGNLGNTEKCARSAHNEREARSPLRPGSRARSRALEAQGF